MDLATLGIAVRSDGVVVATDRLKGFDDQAGRTERSTDALSEAFRRLGPIVGTVMAAFSVQAIAAQADAWSELQARATNATGSIEAGTAVMGRLEDMARRTYSSLDQTANSWLANATSLNAMGVSIQDQLDMVEAMNNAMVVSATRGDRAASVQRAWSNAMALGTLRGDDLNSVLTNSDRLAQALADSMGVNINSLRAMGANGEITRERMMGLTGQLEKLREEADNMPATLADARQIWGNTMTAIVGLTDQALGASESFASSLVGLADTVRAGADTFIRAAVVIQGGFIASIEWASSAVTTLGIDFDGSAAAIIASAGAAGFAVSTLAGLLATTLVGAIRLVGVALLANPMGLFVAGTSAAITAAILFRDEIKQSVGVDTVEVMTLVGNRTIGIFVGAYNAVTEAWKNLPLFFSALGKEAWNSLLDGLSGPAVTWTNPFTGTTHDLFNVDFSPNKAQPTDEEKGAFRQAKGTFNQSFLNTDFIGGMADGLGSAWKNSEQATASLDELLASLDAANTSAQQVGGSLERAGTSATQAARNAADPWKGLRDVTVETDRAAQQMSSTLASGFSTLFKSILDGSKSAGEAVGDLLQKFADLAINSAFQGLFGGGVGGSFLGSIFGGFRANGGPIEAGKSYIVGERGPEVIMPRGQGTVIPNHALRSAHSNSAGPQRTHVTVGVEVDGEGSIRAFVKGIADKSSGEAVRGYDEYLDDNIGTKMAGARGMNRNGF